MLTLPRALLVQQLFKLGVTQSSLFGTLKERMPTADEALPGNNFSTASHAAIFCLIGIFLWNCSH